MKYKWKKKYKNTIRINLITKQNSNKEKKILILLLYKNI